MCSKDAPYNFSKKPKSTRRRRGISIIEVALASTLLIVAMIPILKNLTRAHQLGVDMERKTNSLILAQGKLDEIRARSVYNWSSFTASNVSLGSGYLCNITDDADPNLKTISVRAGYSGNDSILSADEVDVNLVTCIARRW